MTAARQAWPLPTAPRPIVVIGAGAIVRTAHLPAYRRIGLPVAGLFDICREAAAETARQFGDLGVYATFAEACDRPRRGLRPRRAGARFCRRAGAAAAGAAVLIQKPMGETLAARARRSSRFAASAQSDRGDELPVALQPEHDGARRSDCHPATRRLTDIEVRIVDRQPWEQWTFLKGAPRLEVLYHSIHYLDAIRWLAGDPRRDVPRQSRIRSCVSLPTPAARSSSTLAPDALLAGDESQPSPRSNASRVAVQGRRNQRRGIADAGRQPRLSGGAAGSHGSGVDATGQPVALRGSWFSEAFEGPMSNLQSVLAGEDTRAGVAGGRRLENHGAGGSVLRVEPRRSRPDGGVMRIDAHQHFWHYNAAEYGLDRRIDGGAAARLSACRTAREMSAAGFDALYCGAGAAKRRRNTLAARTRMRHASIAGVVGWVDLQQGADRLRHRLASYADDHSWSVSGTSSRPNRMIAFCSGRRCWRTGDPRGIRAAV